MRNVWDLKDPERDDDRNSTVTGTGAIQTHRTFIAERGPASVPAVGLTPSRSIMSAPRTEPIAMLLPGRSAMDRSEIDAGRCRLPEKGWPEWGAGMEPDHGDKRSASREGGATPETTSRDCWTGSARKRGRR